MKMTLCAGAGVAFCLVLLLLLVGQPRPLNASPAHHTGSGPHLDPDSDPDNDSEHIPGNPGQDAHEVTEASAAAPPLPGVPTTSRLPTSYNWKAGPWGSCYSTSGCGEGEQKRSVWCAHLDGRTSLEFLCELRHTPAKWRSCFQVCEEHRGKLSWRVGDWGPCVVPYEGDHRFRTSSNELKDQHVPHVSSSPLPATTTISELGRCRLQPGVMARDVVCVYRKSNHSHVRVVSEDACDHFERKPRSRMSCRLSCPQDCVSTPLGPWMACEGCGLSNRTRTRQVLVAPQNGGRQCPVLQEMYPCSETVACLQSTNRIREYRLRIGPWSECLPQEHPLDDPFSQYGFQAVVGYRTRDILCKDDNGLPTDLSFCLGNESPSVPPKAEACVVPVDCVVSSWSEWEVVAEGCVAQTGAIRAEVRRRRRHILRPPVGEGSPCPHLEETHRLVDKDQLAPCTKYKWVPTEWSDCVLTELTTVRKVMCGGGVQNRNLTCLMSNDMVPVPLVYCAEPPPPVVQRCSVACRQDCVVSSWSAWGICQPFDCSDYFAHKTTGYRERTREVTVWPAAGGNECPTLRQVDACENPSCYQWKTSEFSQCMTLNKEIKCGLGKQSRTAVCISTHGTQVGDALCTLRVPEPQLSVPCYIPCPNDCVLSPWSEWSPCSHVCVDKSDEGYRFRNRTILAPAGGGGTPCPSADKLKETEMCNQHSCHGFGWKAMPWSQCVLSNPENEVCGPGEKTREVRCVRNDDRRYHEKRCNPLPKPAEKSPCKVPCLKDCVLSAFSDWTPCRDACDNLQRRQPKGHHQQQYNHHQLQFQERRRYVMQWPEENRTPCSTALVEKRACPAPCNGSSCPQPCHTYSWAFSEWGNCILPDNMECGTGYRTRGVSCVRSDGQEVEISYCLQGSNGTVSASWQLCRVACAGPCVFSEWSEWTECPPTCSGHQVRTRQLLEDSDRLAECTDSSKYLLEEQRSCPCNVHSAVAKGDFSDCLLGEMDEKVAVNGAEVRGRCGVGWKQRKVTCNDKNGNLADPFLCALTGYEEDSCMIQCPGDCKMTSWSDWSPCTAVCGAGAQHRTRRVEQFDFEGGRPCPAVDEQKKQTQVRLCEASCLQYQWVAYGWTQCELYVKDKSHGCGTGVQTRRVRCMRTDVPQQFEARDELCDPVMRPPDINYCHVPCSNDCVVSEWNEWTVCPHPCDRHRTRRRTRTVVRKPLAIGVSCPMLEEIEACELNKTCFHYNWNFTNSGRWTSCVIHDSAVCGEGVKRRGVVCQRSDGRTVEDKFCEQLGIHRPGDVESTCVIDCPVDCEVSEWSEWNADDCGRCGSTGVVVRMRHVTVPASEMGRPCPVDLVQRKPCLAHPCYDWSSSDWSECELEGGQCGHGTKRREVICRRTDGTAVDRRYCLEANTSATLLPLLPLLEWRWIEKLLDIHEEERCFVPCPGDCVLTAWSDWSPCHRDCENGEQVGSQTRSRAILAFPTTHGEPCPDKLWETKPCFGGPCFTYDWRVKPSSESVECVRSDGLVVIGGCDGKARPCVPACRLAHSECSRQGVCICEHDYQPVFRALHTTTSLHNSATLTETAAINGVGGRSAAQLLRCVPTALVNSSRDANDMAANDNTRVIYYPKDGEASFWMYAMISVGSAFIIFVAVTVYLMCHSSVRHGGSPLRRHSLTMRRVASKDAVSVSKP